MKAIVIENDQLVWRSVDDVHARRGEVRIRVKATAVNRADLSQRAGGYNPPPGASDILGLECSGIVDEIGSGVTSVDIGDSVCALLAGGGYAEQVVVPAGQVRRIPKGFDFCEAGSVPEVYGTAYLNLYREASLKKGESVLIHAGASGVGTAGIQLCKSFGNRVFVTAGSADKIERCIQLGADDGCVRHTANFREKVHQWTNGSGVDVILDPVGAQYFEDNLKSLNVDGRLVIIGLLGGAQTEIPLSRLMMKRLRVIGSTLRARSIEAKSSLMDDLEHYVWPHFESGQIKPTIHSTITIQEVETAHELIASNETFGKVVLKVAD